MSDTEHWRTARTVTVLTDVSSNVIKLGLVGNELLFGWNVDAHVTGKSDGRGGDPDMHLAKEKRFPEFTLTFEDMLSTFGIMASILFARTSIPVFVSLF